MPDPPIRTLASDLRDVERYAALRRELVRLEQTMRRGLVRVDEEFWADQIADLLARYPETTR
jgi:hypothetical protein